MIAAIPEVHYHEIGNKTRTTKAKRSNGDVQNVVSVAGVRVRNHEKNGAEDDGDAYENSWGKTGRTILD